MADRALPTTGPAPFELIEPRLRGLFRVETTADWMEATRGTALSLDIPADHHPVVLVEDPQTGVLAWAWPDQRATRSSPGSGTTVILPSGADRGVVSTIGKKIVRALVPEFVDVALRTAGERMVGLWEDKHRLERLVRFDPLAVGLAADDPGAAADRAAFGDERDAPALILLHGLGALTHSGFSSLRGLGLSRLGARYGERIVGFDHPTLATSPIENARSLARRLAELHDDRPLPRLEALGFGRGGLVARALAAELDRLGVGIELDRVWCVGTPNHGQPLASPDQLRAYLDRLTNLVGWLPLGAVGDVVDAVLATVAHVALGAFSGLDGITAMAPGSTTLAALNAPEAVDPMRSKLFAVASNYVARPGTALGERAKALAAGHVLRGANDLLTTVESVFGPPDAPLVPVANQRLFGDAHSVDHAGYFDHPATVEFVVDTDGSWRGGAPVTADTWRPTIHDEDGTIVSISVSHCSLEEAQFAVMVGTYANESLAGAERFLDHQLGGELMARFQIDRYPSEVGTSLFLPADEVVDHISDPPGAYVVGLGSTIKLGRPELARTVRQALVDRCLRLYVGGPGNEPAVRPASGVIQVGVSSTLMGVRNNDGLSVVESVAGVVEGVLEANRALVRYEATRSDSPTPVRITALEFVERYADRADRAVLAVRSLPSLVRLGPGYDELQHLTVDAAKRGGLPAGSAVNDNPQDWQRFVITGEPLGPDPSSARTLRLEITALGSDARADRLSHELDVAVVDSLVERLGRNRSDQTASSTLFNFLVPDEIRPKFQTSSAVQFVVDRHTANFPWELLSAPRAGQLRRLAESTSVVRQFTESDDRRLAPIRASSPTALVIAAGNLTTLAKLPGVFQEAEVVERALRTIGGLTVSVLDDEERPFDPAALMMETFADHRIVHIASHGEFVAGDPARTGAVLSDQLVLTASKIRLLPFVPDLVFLNCCNLAQIGSNRMAAGLARELMAIGVRAVIAAGWPVGDAAAVAFAATFYEQYLADATFGEAVARARLSCAMAGGGETWAAYQCYGDPTLLFSGNSAAFHGDEIEPTSADDLLRRLRSLEVSVSDLGRRGETDLEARRVELRATLGKLTAWAEDHDVAARPHVGRQIAVVARLLNDFEEAAARFLVNIDLGADQPVTAESVRLLGKESSALDLQQAASCLARAGHARHRLGGASRSGRSPADDLELATALAEAACRIIGDRESYGILGGVRRRRAIVDVEQRQAHLDAAFRAYYTAATRPAEGGRDLPAGQPGAYGYENARQFAALIGLPLPDDPPRAPAAPAGDRRVDERRSLAPDFWASAGSGDQLLTELLRAADADADAGATGRLAERVLEAYVAAFSTRSSFSDRNTTVDQVDCLFELAQHDERAVRLVEPLRKIAVGLEPWRPDDLRVASDDDESATAAETAFDVHVLPAGKGDSLVLEYADRETTRRIWIDGGVASAFEHGSLPFINERGAPPLAVDVLVCTHIDADHVAGAIKLLETGSLTADDIWFNGLAQLMAARGVNQGDEFESLIPPAARNRAVQGRPFVVPDDGALPVIQLPGGAVCTLLSPDGSGLDALLTLWKRQTKRAGEQATVEEILGEFAASETTDGLERGAGKPGVDPSVPNRSSIAFLFEHRGRAALLTGDAHAPVLQRSIERLLANRRLAKLRVDLVKLSHHSSRNNVTPGLLELLDCDAFLICSSGNDDHPDADGLRIVTTKFPDAAYYFSDDTAIVRERAAAAGIATPRLPGAERHRITFAAQG